MEIKHGYLPRPTKDDGLSDTTVPRFMLPLSRRRVDEHFYVQMHVVNWPEGGWSEERRVLWITIYAMYRVEPLFTIYAYFVPHRSPFSPLPSPRSGLVDRVD